MCDAYTPCECLLWRDIIPERRLTLLVLDCWQREYDVRPYRNFKLNNLDFEERMLRKFDWFKDFPVVVEFVQRRILCSFSLVGIPFLAEPNELLDDFAFYLRQLPRIEFKLMELPEVLFEILLKHAVYMTIKELCLEDCPLTRKEVEFLRTFLLLSKHLHYLNVANCSIDQYDFALIADGIYKSPTMRGFNASRLLGNHLTLDTAKISNTLGSVFWQNKLTEVVLRQCEFLCQDMEPLCEYMSSPKSRLLKLDLSGNIIAADGAKFLFQAISHSGTLAYLDISCNSLGSHGGEIVGHYLSSCYSLEHLDVRNNNIGAEAINLLLTAMKKPIKLQQLKLNGNQYNSKTATIVRRVLDARVVDPDTIDITTTYDETLEDYRITPYF